MPIRSCTRRPGEAVSSSWHRTSSLKPAVRYAAATPCGRARGCARSSVGCIRCELAEAAQTMMTRRAGEDEPARWVEPGQTLRAGELTAVWAPDDRHEAMRDLSRARLAAKKDLQGKRQQIISLMLRLGRIYPGKKTWGPAHMDWLMRQKLGHGEQRIAFEELMEAVRQESERVTRLEEAIREAVPERSLAEVVTALQA